MNLAVFTGYTGRISISWIYQDISLSLLDILRCISLSFLDMLRHAKAFMLGLYEVPAWAVLYP